MEDGGILSYLFHEISLTFDLLVVFNSPELKSVIELLEVQLIDLMELLDLGVSQQAEVSLQQLTVRHVQLVGVEPLGLEDI